MVVTESGGTPSTLKNRGGRTPTNMPSYYPLRDEGAVRIQPKRLFARCSFPVLCFSLISIIFLCYALSFLLFAPRPEYTVERHNGRWRRGPVVDIPEWFWTEAENVKITEGYVTYDHDKNFNAHILTAVPPGKVDGLFTVFFLHGAKFSSENWRKLGTLKLVASFGLKAVAIDMPGHGKTPADGDVPDFVARVFQALKIDKPVLVAPSKAGQYAMPYLMTPDPESADDRLRGFVPIAPAGTDKYHHGDLNRVHVPTMILMGERDYNLGRHATADLRTMNNAEPLIVQDAGHACYIDQPVIFHRFLYNFLVSIEPTILERLP